MRELGRIRRSLTDRKIAGVGGGIARHLDIDPIVVRVALVVLVLFGGGGILLYGVAWLIVPDDSGDSVVRMDDRSRSVALLVVGALTALSLVGEMFGGTHFPWPLPVVGVVVIVLLLGRQRHRAWHAGYQAPAPPPPVTGTGGATYAGYQPPPPAPRRNPRRRGPILFGLAFAVALLAIVLLATIDLAGADLPPSAYPAAVLATCGAFLVLGAFWGRAGGLILVGLVAAIATLVTSVADGFDIGQTTAKPDSAAELHSHYHRDIGQVVVDLTDVTDLDGLNGRTLDVDASVGQLTVIVPDEGLDVAVRATIGAGGETVLFGDRVSGSADRTYDGGPGAGVPRLTIDADLRFGQIEVETEKEAA
jgi:phage shock protein PspC (stress-responsive transcriptional regulator)